MKAVVYLRVSTTKQAQEGAGYKKQLAHCIALAKKLGYTEIITFYDEGISGATSLEDRVALRTAVESLDAGDTFIVASISRLARKQYFSFKIANMVKARGAHMVSALEPACNENTNSYAAHLIAATKAEYEREVCITATRESLQAKKQRNECIGTIPYGYKRSEDFITLEPNEGEQEVIACIKQYYALGYSNREIAKKVTYQGLRSRNNTMFQVIQIANIIRKYCTYNNENQPIRKFKHVPYGYAYNVATFKIEPFLPEQEIIAYARALRQEKCSLRKIAEKLNAVGYRNRAGNYFNKNQVAKMFVLRNHEGLRLTFTPAKRMRITAKAAQARKKALYTTALQLRQEGYSFPAIAQEMTKRGYTTKRKKQLRASTIYHLLKSVPQAHITRAVGKSIMPYGFIYDDKHFEVIPCTQEQEIISIVVALHKENHKPVGIMHYLNEKGYRDRADKPFKRTQIDRILKKYQANS